MSRNPDDFKELAKTTDKARVHGVEKFLKIEPLFGETDVNIDFYYVKFSRPQSGTLESLFKDLRLHYNQFAEGSAKDYGFDAYGDTREEGDPVRKKNAELWAKDIPLGALMSFNLDTLWPQTFKKGDFSYRFARADGDLQVTCATKTDFVFSTVESKRGGAHPVSGNRGFGIKDNSDNTWSFYSKAVDRATKTYLKPLVGSWLKNTFCLGHKFWLQFYDEMKKYLRGRGINVNDKDVFSGNHGPVPFPFHPGPQPPTMSCE